MMESISEFVGDWEGQEGKMVTQYKENFGVICIYIILMMVMISWVNTYEQSYQIVHFKYVWFIVCQLYFNKVVNNKLFIYAPTG